MRGSNNDSSSFALSHLMRGHRPYQLTIVFLLALMGWYVTVVAPSYQRDCRVGGGEQPANNVRDRPAPGTVGGPMMALANAAAAATPVCNCNCKCGSGSAASETSHRVMANTDGDSSSSKAVAVSGGAAGVWSAPANVQTYSALPSIGAGTTGKDSYMSFVRAAYPPVGPELGSVLDPSFLSTPIAYGTAFVPAGDDSPIPAGFIPRPACQKDSDILQSYIYSNQHPENCKTKKLLVRKHMPGYGLFAGLGLSSNYLFLAATLERTLVDLSPNTYFTGNCPSNGLDCAFLPVSNCTAGDYSESEVCYDRSCFDNARVISIDRLGLNDFLPLAPTEFPVHRCSKEGPHVKRTLNDILPELGPHGEQFFQGEFSRYLTRPNKRLSAYAAEQMQKLGITDQLIGVHIRHGDKIGEGIQFPTRAYGLVVRRAIQVTGIKTVFIGSDDKSVYAELPKWVDLPGIRYVSLDPDANPIVFSANQARGHGANTIGLALMTQTIIMTQAGGGFIGTRSSNAGQIVYSMHGNDCSRRKLVAYDMYGDLFYNSWYCRNDIQHAGREWMCAMTKPGKDEGYIWKWGGAKTEC